MQIKEKKKIIYDGDTLEVLIGIELDANNTNTWELEDPHALVVYKSQGDLHLQHIELIDRGMKVHGYEFTEDEEKEISNFLNKKMI